MKKNNYLSTKKLNILCSVAAIIIMWLAWIIAYYSIKNDYIMPSFSATMTSLFQKLGQSSFWVSFFYTVLRTLLSFLISLVLAAIVACVACVNKIIYKIIQPIIVFLRTLPTLAVSLMLVIWTNPLVAPVIITILVLFPAIFAQFCTSLGNIDVGIKEMAKVYNVSKRDQLLAIYLPQVSSDCFVQIGANLSLGLKVMVSAEVLCNTAKSLGGDMQYAKSFIDMPTLAALTLVAVFAGFIFEVAFSQLKRINAKWRGADENN